ncbi:hypothetical protein BX285_2013 [Streptomyces sp. 1114.5]|uniref:hypothetical protein n=1 Tax=unclassified Streptomyces TaxID=2593676 RepID=UPI000BD954B5|nr:MULTISPECIES: hypothetical protein [unclassified Streptomyces]RKT17632.1 hypothetical protein BX285_2013 [Streptomyces sp. 1114.5]SOB83836.1 hypothetical protein SAMN06272789_4051 [Streptomyces sp. 1331.2]
MTIGPDELTDRLTALAEEPAPPPTFDPAASIARGRSRLRRRRAALLGAVAAVTAAVVTTTLLLPSGGGAPATTRLVPAGRGEAGTPAPPAAPAVPVGSATDPLVVRATFGWLPEWLDPVTGISHTATGTDVVTSAAQPGPSGRRIELLVFQDAAEPSLSQSATQKQEKQPAPQVNGRTAYWVVDPTHPTYDGRRLLRWQTSSGRWAQLLSNRSSTEVPDEVLLRVAADVKVGEKPVPLPFWLSGLPEGVRPTEAVLSRPGNGQPWSAGLAFSGGGMTAGIIVAPAGPLSYGKYATKCREEQGLQVCATAESDSVPLVERFGGLEAMTGLVHLTGAAESTWTTNVLR